MSPLIDTHGRAHRDLRISLTDRCSLRCSYCMPVDFNSWLPTNDLLTLDELLIIVEIALEEGITEVRLTGGEPLLRSDIVEIVSRINALPNAPELSITTNGLLLEKYATALAEAGLSRVNISLDTLRPECYKTLTNKNRLADVLVGIAAAKSAGLHPIKINSVLMPGINDDEAVDLLTWALRENLSLRFIEQMPLDAGNAWDRKTFITAENILDSLRSTFRLTATETRGSAPAQSYHINEGPMTVGIIASVTQPFCASCDRLRLTSDGQLRSCLFAREEMNLRDILRSTSLSKIEIRDLIAERIHQSVREKLPGHGINSPGFKKPDRPMSAIGG